MYLGYVKAGRLDETDQLYKSKLEALKVQKVFSDSKYDTTALKELLGYVRQGDSIVSTAISAFWLLLMVGIVALALFLTFVQ